MKIFNKLHLCFLIFLLTFLFSNNRVGFSRPGSVIRTPGNIQHENFNQYIVGFSTEIVSFSDANYASSAFFQGVSENGYVYGLSYTTPASPTDTFSVDLPSQIGFHIHKNIFNRNNIRVIVGAHDILYDATQDHRISLFANFAHSYKINTMYFLETTLGFGTGYISHDSHNYLASNSEEGANFFLGAKLHTPILEEFGGMKILAEYDGWGLNAGVSLPVSDAWTINMGISHFENIQKMNDSWNDEGSIIEDAPALIFGFQMNIPNLKYPKPTNSITDWSSSYNFLAPDEAMDSMIVNANTIISALEDSMMLLNQEKEMYTKLNTSLNQKMSVLEDSLQTNHLENKISNLNLNKTLRLLSQSLSAYYAGQYSQALNITNQAIELMPELAISYARKGSIYYKIGDIQRATVNWNLALNLDPDYTEVRDVLMAMKNNSNYIKLPE